MPTVTLAFSAIPGHVRTARLVASTVARRAGVDDALLDEVRLAVGEACSRAVSLHRDHAPDLPIELSLSDGDRFTIVVRDRGPAGAQVAGSGHVEAVELVDPSELGAPTDAQASDVRPEHMPGGFGLAVIAGLVDDLEVEAPGDGPGTAVCMSWPAGPVPDEGGPTG
jgi:anti-sigma regulatory factor (Ser/Thr protein kinase)